MQSNTLAAGCIAAALVAMGILSSTTLRAQQPPLVRALTERWPVTVKVEGIELLPVRKDVYALIGAGANVTVQFGDEGVVLVDSGVRGKSAALLAAMRQLTPRPLRYVINTNPDADHVGGNGDIVKAAGGLAGPSPFGGGGGNQAPQNVGVRTIAHENAVMRMINGSKELPPLTGDAVPDSTFFTPRKDIFANGQGIELLSQPAAHTDGDLYVWFRGSDVVSAGDVYSTESYPHIDASRGGSIQGELDALNTLLDITIPERNQMGGTLVVPGHGRISNEADVVEYRDMLTIIRDRVQDLVKKGMTLPQVKAARPALEYDGLYGTQKDWTGEMFLEAVYRDVSPKK
jgi:glyoxylase-like metal-dependent hydrolase (beta-lactamase superfamily II)